MQFISSNTKTHIVVMTDKEEILITTEQYEAIKLAQRVGKRNEPLELTDKIT